MNENQPNSNTNEANISNNVNAEAKKPFYTKWWIWAIVILALILLSVFGGEKQKQQKTPENEINIEEAETKKPESKPNEAFNIGDNVKAGDIEYRILEAKDSKSIGNNEIAVRETDKNYLVVKVTIKNKSAKPINVNTDMFKLKDNTGNTYSADVNSDSYVNSVEKGFLQHEVSPNIAKTGCIVFETPNANSENAYELEIKNGNNAATIKLGK